MGDEARFEAAKSDPTVMVDLLVHHRGLVLAVVNRYKRLPWQEEDDLIQLGMIGLVNAIRTFTKQAAFSTHATLLIRREIDHRSVRPAKRRACVVCFQDGDADSLVGVHPEADADHEDFELDAFVRARQGSPLRRRPTTPDARRRIVSADLTPRQREVLLARLDGKLQRELGPTQQAAADIERRALQKLLTHDPP